MPSANMPPHARLQTASFGPSYEPAKYQWLWDPEGGAYHISIPAARDARCAALGRCLDTHQGN